MNPSNSLSPTWQSWNHWVPAEYHTIRLSIRVTVSSSTFSVHSAGLTRPSACKKSWTMCSNRTAFSVCWGSVAVDASRLSVTAHSNIRSIRLKRESKKLSYSDKCVRELPRDSGWQTWVWFGRREVTTHWHVRVWWALKRPGHAPATPSHPNPRHHATLRTTRFPEAGCTSLLLPARWRHQTKDINTESSTGNHH